MATSFAGPWSLAGISRLLLLCALALAAPGCDSRAPVSETERAKQERPLTADQAVQRAQNEQIESILRAVDADHDDLERRLAQLGYHDLNGFSAENVSARSLLRHAVQRAEAGAAGDGERLIAALSEPIRAQSASAATDPQLNEIRAYAPDELRRPFTFSGDLQRTAAVRLPPRVEAAVAALAVHGWPHADFASMLLPTLQRAGFDAGELERIAREAPSLREYLRRAIAAGTPPPLPAEAALNLIAEAQARSAVAMTDPRLNEIRAELNAALPERFAAMQARETLTPSYRFEFATKRAAAREHGLPISRFTRWNGPGDAAAGARRGPGPGPIVPPFSGALSIFGTANGPDAGNHAAMARAAYSGWDSRTFAAAPPPPGTSPSAGSGGGGGGGGLPRSFRVASRSVRGPGGVSLGAPLDSGGTDTPVAARWVPKPGAPQFGYYLITMRDGSGRNYSALSRLMFAESGEAAHRAVWGSGEDQSFIQNEGEIFPLVSLDAQSSSDDIKAVVVNPSLAGLQLGWAAVRADFWMRSLEGVLADVAILFPDAGTAAARASYEQIDAATWQIRERPHRIVITQSGSLPRILVCIEGGACSASEASGGFEMAPFTQGMLIASGICDSLAEQGQPCTPQLIDALLDQAPPGLQVESVRAAVTMLPGESLEAWQARLADPQPLEPGRDAMADAATDYIAWLTAHHPDFIRLNDLHQAFALSRWLKVANANVQGPGSLFAPRPFPIPNRVRGGSPEEPQVIAFVAEPSVG